MSKLNKNDLVEIVSEEGHLSKKDARTAVDIVFDNIEQALLKGQEVNITNFGVFTPTQRQERIGTDPKKHTQITIKARKSVVCRLSKELKAKINKSAWRKLENSKN